MTNVAQIRTCDIANGKGIRTSIFFSGCEHHCKNCFNSELWNFNVGEQFNREFYENEIKPTINEHIAGISLLGGESMHPRNILDTGCLCTWFKQDFPDKNIWIWTGYRIEELNDMYVNTEDIVVKSTFKNILNNIDVLVDGRFVEEQKDLTLKWRGSKNQRVINIPETLKENKIILLD